MLNLVPWLLGVMQNVLTFEVGTSNIFVGVAESAATALAILLILLFGLRAYQAVEQGQPPSVGGYFVIALKLGACLFAVTFWNVPAPGLGSPIGTWVPNFGLHLAQLLGWSGAQQVGQNIQSWAGMEIPNQWLSVGTFWWVLSQVFLFLASVALVLVLLGPLVILAAMIVIGPVFVMMWPIPEMTAYARGYVRSLITYSLVPVVAAAVLNVIANIVLPSLSQAATLAVSVEQGLTASFMLCLSLVVGLIAILGSIKVSSQIMSGSAGSGIGWLTGAAAAVKAAL
jgi:hypothetical protein